MISPDKFTLTFWQEDFPGFVPKFTWQQIQENFYSIQHLPSWNIDFGFDPITTLEWLIEHDSIFQNQFYADQFLSRNKELGHEWFLDLPAQGATLIKVSGKRFTTWDISSEEDKLVKKIDDNKEFVYPIPPLLNFLESIPLPTIHISVHRWAPGGFLSPHTDKLKGRELIRNCHVLIPLTKFKGNLKIWPQGEMDMIPGNFYFFNNYDFAHSVWNQSSDNQYAITLSIDHTKLNPEIDSMIKAAAYQRWFGNIDNTQK